MVKEIKSELLNESYYEIDHKSGLKIFVMPKPGYSSCFAAFGTNYGSVDTCFRLKGEQEFTCVPEGIAHFLEHKLFESEELDTFELFAKTGADANAFTSFDRTCYIFQCSDKIEESLEILLKFVKEPYFTQATVEKEQGIIGQEIRMYQDSPDWQVVFNLLRAMYESNPVRIDVTGTVESIAQISADLLYSCYNTFYNLSNMALAVVGNVTVEKTLEIADRLLKPQEPVEIERRVPCESPDVCKDYTEEKMNVAVKKFALGFKSDAERDNRDEISGCCINLLLEIICGKVSPLYSRMLSEGLINSSFGYEHFKGRGFSVPMFVGESAEPEKVRKLIFQELERLRTEGITDEDFETARRRLYGVEIKGFNDVDDIAVSIIGKHFDGAKLFDTVTAYRELTKAQVTAKLQETMKESRSVLSVIS